MDYELYHDESLIDGYWHGMLFVPRWKKQIISDLLAVARANTQYTDKIGIKKVDVKGRIYLCALGWIQIGVAGLRSSTHDKPYPIFLGKRIRNNFQYEETDIYGMKFVLFRERDAHKTLYDYGDHASKIETTFRIGLKGGIHFLGSDEHPMNIAKIHFDGHEHHQRHLDRERIVGRLSGLRDYCSVSSLHDIIDDRHSDHKKPDGQAYEDCQFLQLTDLLIGSFRTALGFKTRDIHSELARPVKTILDRYQEGYARMRNSRWANGFSLSQCYLENGVWHFEAIESKNAKPQQISML